MIIAESTTSAYVIQDKMSGLFLDSSSAKECNGVHIDQAYRYDSKWEAYGAARSHEDVLEVRTVSVTTLHSVPVPVS